MNERIKQLAVQAKEYARSHVADCRRFGYYMEYNEYELRFEKKFAELIVAECLKIAKNREDELESAGLLEQSNAVGIVAYRISRQFGVKR
jgi:hypothetical protein